MRVGKINLTTTTAMYELMKTFHSQFVDPDANMMKVNGVDNQSRILSVAVDGGPNISSSIIKMKILFNSC